MLVYFDENGVLKEQLDSYGNLPRVGSQFFKIFAHFDNIDIKDEYNVAYITLQKPDMDETQYPILFMSQADLTYDDSIPDTESDYFSNGVHYPCYVFDFGSVVNDKGTVNTDDDQVITLLDTPGQWLATITLVNSETGASNVVGSISFNVDGEDEYEDETTIDYNVIFRSFSTALAQKLNQDSNYYIRVCDNFVDKANEGTLLKNIFVANSYVLDPLARIIYKIITVIDNETEIEHNYVYCTSYETVVDFNSEVAAIDTFWVAPSLTWITEHLSSFEEGQVFFDKQNKVFYRKVNGSLENYDIFNPGDTYVTVEDHDYIIPEEDK